MPSKADYLRAFAPFTADELNQVTGRHAATGSLFTMACGNAQVAASVAHALNITFAGTPAAGPLTRSQIDAFMATLFMRSGLSPAGLWLQARLPMGIPHSLIMGAHQRAAMAAELRRLADGIENPPTENTDF